MVFGEKCFIARWKIAAFSDGVSFKYEKTS